MTSARRRWTKRDQGDKFERLMSSYLRTNPEWTAKFSDVWLWSDWPERAGRPDTGIDLVAKNRDDDGFTAIQCKFYAADSTVAKADIDSFLSASSRDEFTQRYIFDTARAWSGNATATLEGLSVPVQRVDIGYLDEVNIDWSGYSWTTPEVLPTAGPKRLRPHQINALNDVRAGLAEHDRGKPPGSSTTRTTGPARSAIPATCSTWSPASSRCRSRP